MSPVENNIQDGNPWF